MTWSGPRPSPTCRSTAPAASSSARPALTVQLVVLLHGFEDDPARLVDHVRAMGIDPATTTTLTPRGPLETGVGPSWFDDGSDLAAALDELDVVIDDEGVERRRVVVGGVSQGGATALALALRASERPPVRGVFAISGFLLPPDAVTYDFARAAPVEVLISHGTDDQVVAIEQGRSAARVLARQGIGVRLAEHPGLGHQLEPAYLDDVRGWLAGLTGTTGPVPPPT